MTEITDTACICGIIMPISHTDDDHTEMHWKAVLGFVSEAIERAGMIAQPVWQNADFDVIQAKILRNLFENEIVVCDVSTRNPNVMLELGMRLTTKKPTIIIAESSTNLPFDTSIINTEFYDPALKYGDISNFVDGMAKTLVEIRASYIGGTYHTYLEHFVFETVKPNSVTVSGEEAIADRLDEMNLRLAKLDRRIGSSPSIIETTSDIPSQDSSKVDGMLRGIVSNSINPNIAIGTRVHHAKFGDGTVAEIDGRKAEVDFDVVGRKRVMDSFITIV